MSRHDDRLFLRTPISLGVMGALAATGAPIVVEAEEIEEIIVTARKREQSIQDAPLPIQAFDTEAIREKGLKTFMDYLKELTSVSFGTASPGATTIAFRGTLAQPTGFDTISSSTLYVDEIPITRDGQNADVRMIDIERLEALSGPQPTLYGAGSQSGVLRIVTNKPDTSEFGGYYQLGGSTTRYGQGSYDAHAVVNVPLAEDRLAIRLVGFYEFEGGYIDNVLGTTSAYSQYNGDRDNADVVEDNINDYESRGGRALLRFEPNEDWTIDAGVIYQKSRLDYMFDFNPGFGDLETIKFKDENDEDEWYNFSITLQGDLGFADLTVAGGWHNRNIDYDIDATAYMTTYKENGLQIATYYVGSPMFVDYATCYATAYCYQWITTYDFGADPTSRISLDQRIRSFAGEVRLTSKDDGSSRFNWLLGGFYERTHNDWDYTPSSTISPRTGARERPSSTTAWPPPMSGSTRGSARAGPTMAWRATTSTASTRTSNRSPRSPNSVTTSPKQCGFPSAGGTSPPTAGSTRIPIGSTTSSTTSMSPRTPRISARGSTSPGSPTMTFLPTSPTRKASASAAATAP